MNLGRLSFISCLCMLGSPGGESVPPTLSVCEALQQLEKIHGRFVRIRGWVQRDVGIWLADPQCHYEIKIKGVSFPPLLQITGTDARWVNYPVPFKTDSRSTQNFLKVVESARPEDRIAIVSEGVIVTRVPLERLIDPARNNALRGFGHLGMAPAQFIVKRDIELKVIPATVRRK